MKRKAAIIALLVVLILVLLPLPVYAQTIVDDSLDNHDAFNEFVYQRCSFYANGSHWVFFIDYNTSVAYARSSDDDGTTWSSRVLVRSDVGSSNRISYYWDGNYAHYAASDKSDGDVYYRRFVPNADGTISWPTAEYAVQGGTGFNPSITVTSSGYPWVGLRGDLVLECNQNDGTWTSDTTHTPGDSTSYSNILTLASGMVLLYQDSATGKLAARRYTGGWGSEKLTSFVIEDAKGHSAVVQDDTVHVVVTEDVNYKIQYLTFASDWSSATELYDAPAYDWWPTITRTDLNDLYVFYADASIEKAYYRRYTYSTSTWESQVEMFTDTDGILNSFDIRSDHVINSTLQIPFYFQATGNLLKNSMLIEDPIVTTLTPSAVATTSASLRGEIERVGTGTITIRGFQYNYMPSPTGAGYTEETGTFSTGVYSLPVTALDSDEYYYVRAYVVNASNTTYGDWLGFITDQPDYEQPDEPTGGISPDVPDVPTNWTRTGDPTFTNEVPGVSFLTAMFGESGLPVSFLWYLLLTAVVTAACILAYAVGRHVLAVGAAGGLCLFMYAALGWTDWWLLFPFILVVLAIWRAESVWGVS
jgi:hypothetical protein